MMIQKKAEYRVRYTFGNVEASIYQSKDLLLIVHSEEIGIAFLILSAFAVQV